MTDDDYKMMAGRIRAMRKDAQQTIVLGGYERGTEGHAYHSGRIAAFTEVLAHLCPDPAT